MYKTLLLSLVLLTSAAWLQAQAYPQTAPTPATGEHSGQMSVQGCLQGSGGNYTLTADDGTTYQLTGQTSDLSAHVGHEVQITGKTSASSAASESSAASSGASAAGGATLDVKSMKHVSKTCKSASK